MSVVKRGLVVSVGLLECVAVGSVGRLGCVVSLESVVLVGLFELRGVLLGSLGLILVG